MSNETTITNALQVINSEALSAPITVIIKDGEPLFVGKEIAKLLGYKNGSRDVNRHVLPIDRITITKAELRQMLSEQENQEGHKSPQFDLTRLFENTETGLSKRGGTRRLTLINESGLYTLIIRSNLPKAREATHEFTSKILPQIRKTGVYIPEGYVPKEHVEIYFRAYHTMGHADGMAAARKMLQQELKERTYQSYLKGYQEGVKDMLHRDK